MNTTDESKMSTSINSPDPMGDFEVSGNTFWAPKVENINVKLTQIKSALIGKFDFTIENGLMARGFQTSDQKLMKNPYPIIVLISGAGGNGKDTFINTVGLSCSACNLSSIEEVKEAAAVLLNYTSSYSSDKTGIYECNNKADAYRQFLHDIKMAWTNFHDGPNQVLLGRIREILAHQQAGGPAYDAIFVHIREPKEIEAFKSMIASKIGVLCLTMIVKGLIDPSDYQNTCDSQVEEGGYQYDITVQNHSDDLDMFKLQGIMFGKQIIAANQAYGINCDGTTYATVSGVNTTNKVSTCTSDIPTCKVTSNAGEITSDVSKEESDSHDWFHSNSHDPNDARFK